MEGDHGKGPFWIQCTRCFKWRKIEDHNLFGDPHWTCDKLSFTECAVDQQDMYIPRLKKEKKRKAEDSEILDDDDEVTMLYKCSHNQVNTSKTSKRKRLTSSRGQYGNSQPAEININSIRQINATQPGFKQTEKKKTKTYFGGGPYQWKSSCISC